MLKNGIHLHVGDGKNYKVGDKIYKFDFSPHMKFSEKPRYMDISDFDIIQGYEERVLMWGSFKISVFWYTTDVTGDPLK
jgi:hypothetical protein